MKQEQEMRDYEKLGLKKLGEMFAAPDKHQEEIIRNEVIKGSGSYKAYFKLKNPLGKVEIVSSLAHIDHWVLLVEDGVDLSICKAIKVNIPRFLQKYDFDIQKRQVDSFSKAKLGLTQQDFEYRALLELLDFATINLHSQEKE